MAGLRAAAAAAETAIGQGEGDGFLRRRKLANGNAPHRRVKVEGCNFRIGTGMALRHSGPDAVNMINLVLQGVL